MIGGVSLVAQAVGAAAVLWRAPARRTVLGDEPDQRGDDGGDQPSPR